MSSSRLTVVPALVSACLLVLCALPGPIAAQSGAPSASPTDPAAAPSPPAATQPLALSADGASALEGTTWRLSDYRRGEMRQSGPEVAAWLTLRAGRLQGSGGCTPMRGRYARMGGAISFRLRAGRPPTCAEQTVLVERAMRSGLQQAASAEVVTEDGADRLVIRDAEDIETLRFEPDDVAVLEGGEWHLAGYVRDAESVPADPTQVAVLTFRASQASEAERRSSGEIVGSSGCNGIVGTYARYADVLSFGPLETSGAPCSPAVAAQEASILAVLDSPALMLDLPADRLTLTAIESGDLLEYVASTPLEGTTWGLERLAGSQGPAQPVTLRLADGSLAGEGPCGAYGGAYVTDGRFITFRDLSGNGSEACALAEDERVLFSALADTVLVERSQPGLRFLDARGRVVARFGPAGAGP